MPIWGAFALIAIGLAAVFVEFFVPAFGLVGIGGLGSIVAAVVLTYQNQPEPWGVVVLVVALLVTPTTLIIAFRRFPKSFFGKRLILTDTQADVQESGPAQADPLVGSKGKTLTPLHPSGMAEVGDRRLSVVTGGEYLDAGTEVIVTAVHGARIVVRDVREVEQHGN